MRRIMVLLLLCATVMLPGMAGEGPELDFDMPLPGSATAPRPTPRPISPPASASVSPSASPSVSPRQSVADRAAARPAARGDSGRRSPERDAVVARVGARSLTRDDLYAAMLPVHGMATLEQLVGRMLIEDELKACNLDVTAAELEAAWRDAEAEFRKQGGADLASDLQERFGLSRGEYLDKVLWLDLAVRKLLQRELSINDSDLFTFFFQQRARYAVPEQIEICHILVDPRMVLAHAGERARLHTPSEPEWLEAQKRALDLHRRLTSGADFAKLAQLHSNDESTKNAGGVIGLFTRGSIRYDGLEEAAFALADGQVSEPVKTVMGYHILLRKRTVPAKEPTFGEIRERVRADYLENVRKTNTVRYLRLLIARAQKDGRLTINLETE